MDRCQNLFEFGDTLADGVCRAKLLQFVAQTFRAARSDVISRARRQSRRRPLPSAALRKIDIFFDEGSAHPEKYRTGRIGRPLENRVLLSPTAFPLLVMIQASAAREFFPRRDESLRGIAPYLSTTTPATYENQEEP